MKAKNLRALPTTPELRDCEKCGEKTPHDLFLKIDGNLDKFHIWVCRICRNGTKEFVGKFEPN